MSSGPPVKRLKQALLRFSPVSLTRQHEAGNFALTFYINFLSRSLLACRDILASAKVLLFMSTQTQPHLACVIMPIVSIARLNWLYIFIRIMCYIADVFSGDYHVTDVGRDGNCMFAALALSFGEPHTAETVRRNTVQFLKEHKDEVHTVSAICLRMSQYLCRLPDCCYQSYP